MTFAKLMHQTVIYIASFTSKVTWLDEISEALKNVYNSLNHYTAMCMNYSEDAKAQLKKPSKKFNKYIYGLNREVCYVLGKIAC